MGGRMRGYLRFLAMVTTALFLCATGASADTRGLTIKLKASEAKVAPESKQTCDRILRAA